MRIGRRRRRGRLGLSAAGGTLVHRAPTVYLEGGRLAFLVEPWTMVAGAVMIPPPVRRQALSCTLSRRPPSCNRPPLEKTGHVVTRCPAPRRSRPDHHADTRAPRAAQRPLVGAAPPAGRRPRLDQRRRLLPRRRAGRGRPGVLRGARPRRDGRPAGGRVSRPVRALLRGDAPPARDAPAGDRAGPRPRDGGGVPARRRVRSRRGVGERHVCDSRRQDRFVLLDPRRPPGAGRPDEGGDGDAVDRPARVGGSGAGVGAGQSRRLRLTPRRGRRRNIRADPRGESR